MFKAWFIYRKREIIICRNSNNLEEFVLYTLQEQAFLSRDDTKTWLPLLEEGSIK